MNRSPNKFLLLAAVILCFARYSQANMTLALSEAVREEKYVTSQGFQDMLDKIIMTGTDKNDLAVRATIDAIRQVSSQCKADGANPLAVDASIEGIIAASRLVAGSTHKANSVIDAASKLAATNQEAAIYEIRKGLNTDIDLIFVAGVPIHDAQGSALAIAGGAALKGLKNAIISIQKAGTTALEALDMAEEIAALGIKAGGHAAEEALKAARATIESNGIAVYVHFFNAAKQACEGLRFAGLRKINPLNIEAGIVNSLKTRTSIDSRTGIAAIARLNNGIKSALKVLFKKPAIHAAHIMKEGLISTITETADAISVAKKALKKAGNLAKLDTDAAVAIVQKGIQAAQDEVVSGSAGGYLGLGAAGQIAGKKAIEGLIPAVLEIEHGRVTSFVDLEYAGKIATNGLRTGGLAAVQSIITASLICEAAGNALYTQFADGGDIGFEVLRNL